MDELTVPLLQTTGAMLEQQPIAESHLRLAPVLALYHISGCIWSVDQANRQGLHSVALCLIRQCVEALTIVDVGLQDPDFSEPLLGQWYEERQGVGGLRKELQAFAWFRYGLGLWTETWSDFFATLARAVQPYAHYTPPLQQWQFAAMSGNEEGRSLVRIGPQAYDPLKASRITLLLALVTWALGRMLESNDDSIATVSLAPKMRLLGTRLSESSLLIPGRAWDVQLWPHMWFKEGHRWRDA